MTSNIKYRSIGDRMRDLDLSRPNREIAAELGCHPDTVQQNRHRLARGYVSPAPRGPWTDERIEILKQLWADGFSASQVARRLGDTTRNAVIAKIHRLGLAGRATRFCEPYIRTRKVRPAPIPRPVSPLAELRRDGTPTPPPAVTDIPRVSFDALNEDGQRHCRWPCLDTVTGVSQASPMFCGAAPVPGLPYCKAHSLRAFAPPQPRQRETFIPRDRNVMEREKESVA